MCKKQVVSEGCREVYVQRVARRTVRVCTGGRGRLGLDDLLLLRGLRINSFLGDDAAEVKF